MFSITSVLQAFFSAAGKLFDLQNTEKEHRSETVVIETAEDVKKAIDAAERALLIADLYTSSMRLKHRLKYKHWCSVFRKYN